MIGAQAPNSTVGQPANKKAADPGEGSAALESRSDGVSSQTGNPQGEVPLLPRPASGVVTTYCFCVWSGRSAASLRLRIRTADEIATDWCCAGLPAASTTAGFMAAALVGRHIAAAVMPLPWSPDSENGAVNEAVNGAEHAAASPAVLVTFPTAAHHLPVSGFTLAGVPSPTGPIGRLRPTLGGGQRIYWAFICAGQGSRIHSTVLDMSATFDALHSSSTSAA